MNEPKKFSKLTQHLILFSKFHYGTVNDWTDDLTNFMVKWSGTPKEYYTDRTIYRIVVGAFTESCNRHDIEEHLLGIYDPMRRFILGHDTMTIREQIGSMLGFMQALQVREHDKEGKLHDLIELPEPNPKYFIGDKEEAKSESVNRK